MTHYDAATAECTVSTFKEGLLLAVFASSLVELRLHQPDFDIRPFSAMLGTLKVKPDVLVRCSIRLGETPKPPPQAIPAGRLG